VCFDVCFDVFFFYFDFVHLAWPTDDDDRKRKASKAIKKNSGLNRRTKK